MMTSFAAILGAVPIALGAGAGAELRQPLGVAVVGGLILSQMLTLFITPVIYVYLDRIDRVLKRRLEPQLEEVDERPRTSFVANLSPQFDYTVWCSVGRKKKGFCTVFEIYFCTATRSGIMIVSR